MTSIESASNRQIRDAFAKGYRISADGVVTDPEGRVVRPHKHKVTGYWYFCATGCRAPLSVHRFAAYQQFGDVALASECVRHRNDDRNDNSLANLNYGTKSQNQFDIPVAKRSAMGVKRNAWKRRFTPDQVREIRALLAAGWSLKQLRGEFGGGYGTFANIRDGVTYLDVTGPGEATPKQSTPPAGSDTVPAMPRRPKTMNARVRELAAKGASPDEISEKLKMAPSHVKNALHHDAPRGRPRARGVPVRIRLPADIIDAADARVTPERDRNAVLVEALRKGLVGRK